MSDAKATVAGQPNRDSRAAWALAGFASLLVAVGLLFALRDGDEGVADSTTTVPISTTVTSTPVTHTTVTSAPTPLTSQDYEPIDPGVYFVDAGSGFSTLRGATLVVDTFGWIGSIDGVNFNGDGVALHLHLFVEPFAPACGQTRGVEVPAGSTAADVADGLAASGLTVTESPAPVTVFGHEGYHVTVELPPACEFGGDPGFTHYDGPFAHLSLHEGDSMEVWTFDIDGQVVMVEALWLVPSPTYVVTQLELERLRAVVDSLVLVP